MVMTVSDIQTATSTTLLSNRDRAVLRAIAAGRCVLAGTALRVDGLLCADQFTGARLAAAGLERWLAFGSFRCCSCCIEEGRSGQTIPMVARPAGVRARPDVEATIPPTGWRHTPRWNTANVAASLCRQPIAASRFADRAVLPFTRRG
jgi:hypothetical protein